ncbi:pentapeptide repeat-containing protein [Nocardia nova]|uniref:pentapeptide repeat-containing protein n=1 Tax=Nocardia nova TaxID=37330 RepID=UPI0015E4198E|nr:pentapeptide repeat-containing protein [Nocardia nova]
MLHPDRGGTAVDITKLALAVVGGVAAVGALVIAYQQQPDLRPGRFDAAMAQLGAEEIAVRIAGVYAMAEIADESYGYRRQQCINMLCEHLRLSNHANRGAADHHAESLRRWADPNREQDIFDYRRNDREVRATIARVISAHLRPEAECSWSTNNFDFTRAHFEDADFSGATFSGDVRFHMAVFSGTAWFNEALFSGDDLFDGAEFGGDAYFQRATFSGDVLFRHVIFSGDVRFDSAAFSDTAWFNHAMFCGTTMFTGAVFGGDAYFQRATFSGTTWFNSATFSGDVRFDGVAFDAAVTFENANFGRRAISFADPRRWGPPEPAFDWSADIILKPPNVEPHDWPPSR